MGLITKDDNNLDKEDLLSCGSVILLRLSHIKAYTGNRKHSFTVQMSARNLRQVFQIR